MNAEHLRSSRGPSCTGVLAAAGAFLLVTAGLGVPGCATGASSGDGAVGASSAAASPVPSASAARTSFRHPTVRELDDLRRTFFRVPGSPEPETLVNCDLDFRTEKGLAHSDEDFFSALPGLIGGAREKYHWCFYFKLMELREAVAHAETIEARRDLVVARFPFLTYVARVLQVDFADPGYLASAIHAYRAISEKYFGRKLELSPRTQAVLGDEAGVPAPPASPGMPPGR